MLYDEAVLIGRWIRSLQLEPNAICLNLGSSTREFREKTQPYIQSEMLAPIAEAGCRIINCDLKADDGVDEAGDLLEPEFQHKLAAYRASLVTCCNLLEHLEHRPAFVRALDAVTRPGGYCLITVPRSFPYHPDPLDTMYRPAPAEISALLPGWQIVRAEELAAGSYWAEIAATPSPLKALARQIARSLVPFYRPRKWRPAAHKLLWLFRPYRVSLVLLRKPERSELATGSPGPARDLRGAVL